MNRSKLVKIRNVFADSSVEFKCFGCSPHNKIGLNLEFYYDQSDAKCYSFFEPQMEWTGFPGVTHGGLLVTIADEVAYWNIFCVYRKPALSTKLSSKFFKPVLVNQRYCAVSAIKEHSGSKLQLEVKILKDSDLDKDKNEPFFTVDMEYFMVDKEKVLKIIGSRTTNTNPDWFEAFNADPFTSDDNNNNNNNSTMKSSKL